MRDIDIIGRPGVEHQTAKPSEIGKHRALACSVGGQYFNAEQYHKLPVTQALEYVRNSIATLRQ